MRRLVLGLFLMTLFAPAAWAQTGKHFAIGGSLGFTKYVDSDFSSKNPGFGIAYRINLKPEGADGWKWAPKSGLGWATRDASADIGGTSTHLGKLRTVLVMVGIQRAMRKGPWQLGMGVVAGPSFNSFKVAQSARDAYQSRLGRSLLGVDVKTSLAVRPEVSVWYDLGKMFGVQGSVGYLFDRPKTETSLPGETTTTTWTIDHASASLGLVVGLF